MVALTVREITARWDEMIDRIDAGEEVIVLNRGKPYARMVLVAEAAADQTRGEGKPD